jgi:integrase
MVVKAKRWVTTDTNFLLKDSNTGRYYCRFYLPGNRAVWQSLKTTNLRVAKAKLANKLREHREQQESVRSLENGDATVAGYARLWLVQVKNQVNIKASTVHYYEQIVKSLLETWPELETAKPKSISRTDCERWAKRYSDKYSPTRYNNAVDVLRHTFQTAIEQGALYKSPAADLGKRTPNKKKLELPSKEQFEQLVSQVRKQKAWCSKQCGDLIEFLAFTGTRLDEAKHVRWSDVTEAGVWIHGGETGTKNKERRLVPLNPRLSALLKDLRDNPRYYRGDRAGYVLAVSECQKAINRACTELNIPRITHHDLRHLFATRCIESGVDVPTVARWLGHKDGGALLMRTYSHLLQQHSKAMAAKVSF